MAEWKGEIEAPSLAQTYESGRTYDSRLRVQELPYGSDAVPDIAPSLQSLCVPEFARMMPVQRPKQRAVRLYVTLRVFPLSGF